MQSMVLTLEKWPYVTWNVSSSLKIYFTILPLCRLQLPLRKNSHSHSAIGENDRMLSMICVFKEFWFSSRNLCRLTCDLGSLSLLSNRADSLVTSVSPQVCNCGEPPDRLRSEISFLRTCNIPNLISHIHRIALPKRFTGCVSTWLWNCMRTEANICSM